MITKCLRILCIDGEETKNHRALFDGIANAQHAQSTIETFIALKKFLIYPYVTPPNVGESKFY
jgi:hypothetical protein